MRRLVIVLSILFLLLSSAVIAAQDDDAPFLRIGYIPIMVMEQNFVIADQGWYDDLNISGYEEIRFSSGAPIVQAFAAGELDVAYVGINPALVIAARGVPAKVVASNVTDALSFLANDEFAAIWAENPTAEAFGIYEEQAGRKLRVATLPEGTTPDVVLKYWVNQIGAEIDDIEIIPLGVEQVQAALATNEVDASLIMEPVLSLAQEQDWGYQVLVDGSEILDSQPGATLVVSQDLIDNNPELVTKLVELHIRATQYALDDLDEAARIASERIGEDVLSLDIARVAVENLAWTANPHRILESTQIYNEFQVELGVFDDPVDFDTLFDLSFYDTVIEAHPDWADPLEDDSPESEG